MNTNMFDNYYDYKVKTVYDYSILLSKIIGVNKNKFWHKRKSIEESLDWIIRYYFKEKYQKKISKKNQVRLFINDKDIFKYKIDDELYATINYFIEHNRGFEIKAYEKEIVLVASIIHIANMLDVSTSPYQINKNNYRTILINALEDFNRISYFNLIDNGKKNTEVLLELVKSNVKKERRIFDLLNNKTSFNKYIDIGGNYYLAQYNYSIPNSKKIDSRALKYVYDKEGIDDKFVIINRDLIIVSLMKMFSKRKLNKTFFLPIKGSFFEDENNVKEISSIYKYNVLSKYIKILINYNDFNDNIKELLEKYKIDYYLYCSKNTTMKDISNNKYLLSNDFYEANLDKVSELKEKELEVIIENFKGIVIDNDLINESEEY